MNYRRSLGRSPCGVISWKAPVTSVVLEMRLPHVVVGILLVSLLLLAGVNLADASWNALSSGYAVTTNWHGIDVPIGQSVTATAGTTDSEVRFVEFRWMYPNQSLFTSVRIDVSGPLITPTVPPGSISHEITDWANQHDGSDPNYPRITYWYAQNIQILTEPGDWGVQAKFYMRAHDAFSVPPDTIKIRATSFNAVPEVPFGTVAILLSWIGVLAVFALRKKHLPI